MKGLFQSKDHKKAKSAKLQQQLQLQEDKLWKVELQKRRQQELRDEEMARKLAEEYGVQQDAPSPGTNQELSDEQLARILQEEYENNEQQSGASRNTHRDQELSDEQLARRLQEEFEAAEREERQRQQGTSPHPETSPETPPTSGAPPPLPSKPTAYNHHSASSLRGNTPQVASSSSSSSLGTPARPGPAREVPPPPYATSSSSGNATVHLPPREYVTSTPSPQQVTPSPVGASNAPMYPSNNNTNNASPSSPVPVTGQPTYPPVTQHGYQQQHAFANTAPPSSPVQTRPYHAAHYPPSSQTPAPHQQTSPQPASSAAAPAPSHSYPQQPLPQQNHQNYAPQQPLYHEHQTGPQHQAPYPEHPPVQQHQPSYAEHQQQSYPPYQQPEQPYVAPQQHTPESRAQPHQAQEQPSPSVGATLFGTTSSVQKGKEPMMFVLPSEPAQAQPYRSSTPNQYMAMPIPPVHRSSSPAAYPKDTKRPPSSNATHVHTPKQPPAPILKSALQKPHEKRVEYRNVVRPESESDEDNQDLISYVRRAEAAGTKKSVKGKARRVKKGEDETDPFADSFAVEASSSDSSDEEESEESEDSEEEASEEEEDVKRRRAPPPPIVKKKEPVKQKEPAFNPAEYFDEEDLVDLNAASDVDTGSGSSADEESDAEEVQKKERVTKPIQPAVGTLLDLDDPVPEIKPVEEAPVKERARVMVIEPKTPVEESKAEPKKPVSEEREQKKPAEKPKLASGRATATRWDPTFSSSMVSLSMPVKKPESNKTEDGSPPPLDRQGSDIPSPSVSVMQARLAGILVDDNKSDEEKDKIGEVEEPRLKGDKTQETIDAPSRRTPSPMMYHSRSRSAGSLIPPDIGSTIPYHQQLHHTPYVAHTTYEDMSYMTAPQVFPGNVLRAGAPPGMVVNDGESPAPSLYSYPNVSTSEVPSGEYGYYRVDAEANGSSINLTDNSDAKSATTQAKRFEKDLPKIPKTDPNHRHITVPSINPGQRVWIRVNPTDTGRSLAQRIHIVATYKSRKILSITTANGRDIALDDSAVFEDWHEVETLEDGAPWQVEWGPLDHSFIGGRQLMKKLKAGLREAVKEQ